MVEIARELARRCSESAVADIPALLDAWRIE
jgi:hypothetical protein